MLDVQKLIDCGCPECKSLVCAMFIGKDYETIVNLWNNRNNKKSKEVKI